MEKEIENLKEEVEFLDAVIKLMLISNLDDLRGDWKKKSGSFAPRTL